MPALAASMAEVRDTSHALLGDHEKIHRAVEEIEGGVATTTLSEDPAIAKTIRVHVRQMQARVVSSRGIPGAQGRFDKLTVRRRDVTEARGLCNTIEGVRSTRRHA